MISDFYLGVIRKKIDFSFLALVSCPFFNFFAAWMSALIFLITLKNGIDIPDFSVAKAGEIAFLNSIMTKMLIYDWLDLAYLG
ncbi:hypothetical protein AU490_05920 [Lonsdalea populi]|uniref:Uncharacterized protein n=2 Tax=Lonsdalea TaxID=1082702 RepID=A0ACD1JB51_9GAMM|nr:hypothetical protein AU508_07475 [Lonsdalea populi]RAT12574.1 hypothetical protein AU485_11435 [Lonsdalea quercina]OSN02450.1 hypothetical protein AU499_02545 [Lonsdalea populi]RAT18538.1 hypothetical protein AU486_00670 [Lonsdalea quercina]RAT19116.1 hypothetical protein AU487_12375 [Lonsdalea populi]